MSSTRLEAFSDGVLAIIITIMVLELKVPTGGELTDLKPLIPIFLAYILSFQVIGIYWNNHHHLLHSAKEINPKIMWANLHLLFWLSLVPFFTGWLGEHYSDTWPTAAYGVLMLLAGVSYQLLQNSMVTKDKQDLIEKLGDNQKGKLSLICYILAVILAFINPLFSDLLYFLVAIIWFIPDSRLVKAE